MNATVLIVGASGMVGGALARHFSVHGRVLGTFCRNAAPDLIHLDLRDQTEVRSVLHHARPEVVLCPAAESNVELCEIDPVATRQLNVEGLQNLIEATAEMGAFLVYFSTEYVFDGRCGPYSEDDACNPLNEYGRQKMECERLIAAQLDRHLIARISGVYDWEKQNKNFVVRLINCLGSGQSLKVPFDQVITPTYAPNLARIVHKLVEGGRQGRFHLSGSLALLRTDFARLIANVFELDASLIIPVPTSRLGLRAERPHSAGLRIDRAQALLDFPVDGPREGLEAMKKERALRLAVAT
jgi:dTDP-4-dehydrorhamnose reductase